MARKNQMFKGSGTKDVKHYDGGRHASGAHVKKTTNPRNETAYYQKNRSPMGHIQGAQVHRKATRQFSQYDTSAIQPHKGRGRKIVVGIIIAAIVIVALIMILNVLGVFKGDPKKDVAAGVAVELTIPEGASTSTIAGLLFDADVIRDQGAFVNAVTAAGSESSLKPGTYTLETLMDNDEVVTVLVAGPGLYGTRLTIPEGSSIKKTAAAVEASLPIKAADFTSRALSANDFGSLFPFVQGAYNNSLEGFLFPKTYDVPDGSNADSVIKTMLAQFQNEIAQAGISTEGANGLSLNQIVTIASMIEGETSNPDELALVSSVIYNRLEQRMPLQIDATVIYALGDSFVGPTVTYDDLEVDSPYNTYKNQGLPPGPINSPGIDSLKAAAAPADTDYLYYLVTGADGKHSFFNTYEEFLAAKEAQ